MAKERNRLKDVVVKRLLGRKQPGMHPDGAGLYLRIRDGGGASWTFRYKLHGKDRWLDLGDPRDTSLAHARVLAGAERAKVDEGRDPIAERRAADDLARKHGTFAELAEEWYAAEVEHRLKHPEAVRRALDNYLLKKLGRTPVAEVKAADCARLLDDVRDKHPTTANDLLRRGTDSTWTARRTTDRCGTCRPSGRRPARRRTYRYRRSSSRGCGPRRNLRPVPTGYSRPDDATNAASTSDVGPVRRPF